MNYLDTYWLEQLTVDMIRGLFFISDKLPTIVHLASDSCKNIVLLLHIFTQ